MSESADNIPTMPDRSQRVREALLRFETLTARPNAVMSLNDEMLFEVGLMLSDRELSIVDAWQAANKNLSDSEKLGRTTFYRFADKFKKLLGQVTAEYARRSMRLKLDDATDGQIDNLNQIARHRFTELLTEKLMDSDDLDDIDRYMGKMAAWLGDVQRARQADERLEMDRLDLDRKLTESNAKLELSEQRVEQMRQDAAHKQARINERLSQLQTQIDGLLKRASRGQQITADHLRHANADLESLRQEAAA